MKEAYIKYKLILLCLLIYGSVIPVACQSNLPEKPVLDYVSVDTSDQGVVISWTASATPGILKYVISELGFDNNGPYGTPLDSVASDVYTYKHIQSDYKPLYYTVTAIDSVGESELGIDYHRPVKLSLDYDSCSREIILSWNRYIGWQANLNGYRILFRKDNDPFQQIALVDSSTLSYSHKNIEENTHYEYLIKAFDNQGKISFSNKSKYFTYMPPPPSYVNLDYVTVLDELTVEISFTADLSGEINDFRLMKASSAEVSFTDWVTITDIDATPYIFTDQLATAGVHAYYRVDALSNCLFPISSSNIGTNILLRGEAEGSLAKLNWNPYTNFEGGVEGYSVYRKNPAGEYELISTLGQDQTSYIEDVSMIGQDKLKGEIFYQVVARESSANPYGVQGESRSNELSIAIETQLFIPNAFSPNNDDMNDIFKPVLDFTPSSYKMLIYDRSGKMLFQTNDPYDGWDGSLNGRKPARQGVYVYHIEYTSYTGIRKVMTGNVSLVNP